MKTITVRTVSLLLLILLCAASVNAQQASLDTLVNRFDRFRSHGVGEKIYAHVNQKFFITGETLWFKVFAVDATLHKPLDLSKVAYAEVLDKANFPVLQAKIKLNDGRGSGSLFLPASLSTGQYRLRIYTNWMKNFSPEFFFDEVFTLVNPFVIAEPAKQTPTRYTVDFFPEGGNLVSGIKSKIAFRIQNERGHGENIQGWILNERNDTITSFAPRAFGIGHFYLTPSTGTQYKAVLANAGGKTYFPLPESQPAGYTMSLEATGDLIRVTVRAAGVNDQNVYLFAHARQEITRAERKPLQGSATFDLPVSDMRDGINHLTLFNKNLEPLCERLYFSYPKRTLEIDLTTNQKVFAPRRQVSVTLRTHAADSTAPAHLSMSVYKLDSLTPGETTHIIPYLWMTSDLTGRIESPQYYFDNKRADVVAAMDDLMLTHGWRRFEWNDVISGKEAAYEFIPELNGHIVTARITSDGHAKRGVFTHLGSPGKIIRSYASWSNEEGLVRFEIKDFYGPRKVILQTQTDTTEQVAIAVQNAFSSAMDSENLNAPEIDPARKEELLARTIGMQVQDIFYYEQSADLLEKPVVDSSAFFGKADATYYLDDYTRFPVMEEVMREYVPGVFVRKRKDGFHFVVANGDNLGVLYGDPMILVDGVPVLDADNIMRMDPLRVKKLEVVKRIYYLGVARFSGIVSYTTYQGDLGGVTLDPRSVTLNYEGLQMKRKFFKPEYIRTHTPSRLPDQRYMLHWEPAIATGSDGTATVQFYTSDVPGQYRVTVEGLTDDGYSGSQTLTFTVRPPDNQ